MAICPHCGVGSNLVPCYDEGQGAAVPQRMSYCGHLAAVGIGDYNLAKTE